MYKKSDARAKLFSFCYVNLLLIYCLSLVLGAVAVVAAKAPYFTSATGQIGIHTAPKYGTKPIRYVMLHFRYRRGAASLRHRNRAATTALECKHKP